MLIRLFVENFRSFDKKTIFSMVAGDFSSHPSHVTQFNNSSPLLKGAAIYGANGAGKSNIVQVLDFLKEFITKGTRDLKSSINLPKFKLDKYSEDKPTKFEIDFRSDSTNYSYGLSVNKNTIIEEWLYILKPSLKHEMIFERETSISTKKNKLRFNQIHQKSKREEIRREIYEEDLRFNQPFINDGFNKNIKEIKSAYNWFDKVLSIIFPESTYAGLIDSIASEDKFKPYIEKVIKMSNTGISSIETEKMPLDAFFASLNLAADSSSIKEKILKGISEDKSGELRSPNGSVYKVYQNTEGQPEVAKLITIHEGKEGEKVPFELEDESDGTQRLINLIPTLVHAIEEGGVYVIDEIDRSLHPILIKEFIKTFFEARSPKNGQLIFTTHEDHLLDLNLLREDEIWFVEKDKDGSSCLYSLSDFKPTYDNNIQQEYLQGKFGAIPFLGNLQDLGW